MIFVGYTPTDGYRLQLCVMWMPPEATSRSRACAAALRGASVYLRHMTNESKFTPVKPNFFLVVISRVKSLFEVQVKSSGASTKRGGSADIELNGTVLRTTADVITRE